MSLPLPDTLTPSKLTKFTSCPLAFRFSYIDRLPEAPSPHLVRGTLVHKALQILVASGRPESRTPERAQTSLGEAWDSLERFDIAELDLSPDAAAAFRAEAADLVERYFAVEDPRTVHAIGVELDLRVAVDGIEMRGIIDRLDYLPGGDLVVVDYKTGRAPRPEHARSRMVGVQFYALLCEQILGRLPREVRLVYLREPLVVVESPTSQTMRGIRQRAVAVWRAIERSCERDDFRPSPSPLCKSCSFQRYCPAFGGNPDEARAGAGAPARAAVGAGAAAD
ncbi:MAG: RecB family exonuclease [Acidimicrobiales bacterium]